MYERLDSDMNNKLQKMREQHEEVLRGKEETIDRIRKENIELDNVLRSKSTDISVENKLKSQIMQLEREIESHKNRNEEIQKRMRDQEEH